MKVRLDRPEPNTTFVSKDGGQWVVKRVTVDAFEPTDYVVQLVAKARMDDLLADTLDIYGQNWALWCEVNGIIPPSE